jgi:hypothetical protein
VGGRERVAGQPTADLGERRTLAVGVEPEDDVDAGVDDHQGRVRLDHATSEAKPRRTCRRQQGRGLGRPLGTTDHDDATAWTTSRTGPVGASYGPVRSNSWSTASPTATSSNGLPSARANATPSVAWARQRAMNPSTESSNIWRVYRGRTRGTGVIDSRP